ncbi:MAG: hypothetical protein AAF514_13065 [Verrucomicrobiota bacterium]
MKDEELVAESQQVDSQPFRVELEYLEEPCQKLGVALGMTAIASGFVTDQKHIVAFRYSESDDVPYDMRGALAEGPAEPGDLTDLLHTLR